ncbi:MAG: DUF5688 family protein [Lachnospiraceae bacterium]|nr:DUF5688 family protein [Lachnospiraceae bacterium]
MMNYEDFKKKVENEFANYLGTEFDETKIVIHSVYKTNCKIESLALRGIKGHENMSPSLSLNGMFKYYKQSENFEKVMSEFAEIFTETLNDIESIPNIENNIEGNIFFTLINTKMNTEFLKDVPHREFEDLSIVYRLRAMDSDSRICSTVINNRLASEIGKTEDELFELAKVNTKTIYPIVTRKINEIIVKSIFSDMFPPEIIDEIATKMAESLNIDDKHSMYVITNKVGVFGASSFLYEDVLFELANKVDSNLYILPSSINEVIAISSECDEPRVFADMVYDINMSQVPMEEILSNSVYLYNRDERKVSIIDTTESEMTA